MNIIVKEIRSCLAAGVQLILMNKFYLVLAVLVFIWAAFLTRNSNLIPYEVPSAGLSESKAREIAENTCIKGGGAVGQGEYDIEGKAWRFDANLNTTREGCIPICKVDKNSSSAELVWECESTSTPTPTGSNEVVCTPQDRKAEVCTKIYQPVCAKVNVQCIKAPCNPIRETYGNSCEACSNQLVESYYEGICNDQLP